MSRSCDSDITGPYKEGATVDAIAEEISEPPVRTPEAPPPLKRPRGRPCLYNQPTVGDVFGELTVIAELGRDDSGNRLVRCRCSCGREKTVYTDNLRTGKTRACYHPKAKGGAKP